VNSTVHSFSVSSNGGEVNVISLFHVAWRYKFFIAGVGLLFTLLAIYLAMTATFVYRAEATLTEVSSNGMGGTGSLTGRLGGLASLAGINLGNSGPSRDYAAMLTSRRLAEEFISRYKLVPVILGDSPRQSLWLAADHFRQKVLKIAESKEKGTTTVSVQWKDPKVAAEWVNNYVALANETLRLRALEESRRNIRFLNEQIAKTDVVGVQRVMYDLVENETKVHMLANTRKEYAFNVIDPASAPEDRIWPRRSLMVITGAALGGVTGLFLALAYNMWARQRETAAARR
jgi:uncharacterized protein involved in exopolysaccharide biosynthesis